MPTVIGVDQGVNGALAVLPASRSAAVVIDIPTVAQRRGKRSCQTYDVAGCDRLLYPWDHVEHQPRLFLERLQAGSGKRGDKVVRGSGRADVMMGYSMGMWETLCYEHGIPLEYVSPPSWKKALGLTGCDKEASRARALQLFPKLAAQLSRKKDHNRAEALLIAEWAWRHLYGGASDE